MTTITELDATISALKAIGIHEHSHFAGKVGQSHQIRVSLYTKEGEFVAFFCQYTIPANERRGRSEATYVNTDKENAAELTDHQNNLINKWLVALTAQYPPT